MNHPIKRTAALTLLADLVYLSLLYTIFSVFPHASINDSVILINLNFYFLLFMLSFLSLRYSIANRTIIKIFVVYFLYSITFSSSSLFIGEDLGFFQNQKGFLGFHLGNIYWIFIYLSTTTFNFFISIYLFFRFILTRSKNDKLFISISLLLSVLISVAFYWPVIHFENLLHLDNYFSVYQNSYQNAYYLNILNLAFLLIFWIYYNQGKFVMSDYIPSILSLFTLSIIVEIFHSFSFLYAPGLYQNGLYFNAMINLGLILLWSIRIIYLTSEEAKENENYVLNYDLLQGFIEKPRMNNINRIIMKYGRRNIIVASVILFILVAIPLLNYKPDNVFIKFNILILILSLFVSIIYTLIYIQKRWYNIIGFIFKNRLK